MISVEEALAILHENIPAPQIEKLSLSDAHSFSLSEDVFSPEPSPRYTNSAMDGYAVKWSDCKHATKENPVRLRIIGESQAGIPFNKLLKSGAAIRISTGAMVPAGADTIIRVEDTVEQGDCVDILSVRCCGQDIRKEGEEFTEGSLLFSEGTKLGARDLALLAAVGVSQVSVFSPPKVSLLITGTELANPDSATIKPHQIRDSNSIMLTNAVKESGGVITSISNVKDDLDETIELVKEISDQKNSIILCSGGVSVGRHDHVKDAALVAGYRELFWKIKQKPGKPLFVCKKDNTLLFGLPGNPVSAFMCFHNYVRPVLNNLQGNESIQHSMTSVAMERVENKGSRTNFIRVVVEEKANEVTVIKEMEQQGSHMLSSIVHADGYIVLEPGEVLNPGDLIEVFLF